ncbi:MAG: Crp/Fnr family transcriptional regulator [Flavobacteriales bacterium]|nr:Crp/Fnr family transcriptional regulator [Flavobacteriales bacterium]
MSDEVKFWHLRNHQLFWVLNNSQVRQLCIITNFKRAQKGELIDFGEKENSRIYLLKKGNLKLVQVDEKGNELIVDIIQQGELFGSLTLDREDREYEYAQVLTDRVVLCSFNVSDFERLLAEYPTLAISYTKLVGFRLKRVKNRYSNLFFKNTRERLIAFLNDWANREGRFNGMEVSLDNFLTQKEISQIICSSRQTTTQIFNEWEQKGLISYTRKEILIKNLKALV